MKDKLEKIIKNREIKIKKGESFKCHKFACAKCGSHMTECVPLSEGWQPFGLDDCKECGEQAPFFIGYTDGSFG